MKIYSVLIVPLFLLGMQCAKESEENEFYKNERLEQYRYNEHPVTKQNAIEYWENFLKESQDLISYSRNNLESLQYQIDRTSGAEKFELLKEYGRYKKAIDDLELKRQQRNHAFNNELSHYNQESHGLNDSFRKNFKREIIRINIGLGCKADDQPESFP